MKRIFPASLLGFVLALASASTASAQAANFGYGPDPSNCGTVIRPYAAGCHQHGCGGFCFRFLGSIHQHGPLFNYGPYAGYYPFEPYGPWTAQLQYTGPRPGDIVGCGWHGLGCKKCGKCGGHHCRGGDCGSDAWGDYASGTLKNVFDRTHPRCHKAKCGSCGEF